VNITIVAGCRPEFVKLGPVVAELRRRGESPTVLATGQHTTLLAGTPFDDGMRPDVNLGLAGTNDPFVYASVVEGALRAKWAPAKPELVVVQGDTASAYAGALAASHLNIPVAHIEAGIRSGDFQDPFPEETFRVEIDKIANFGFAATRGNERRATGEWYASHGGGPGPGQPTIWVTGNPGIDALYAHTQPLQHPQQVQDRVLVTLHRRESFGAPLHTLVAGLLEASQRYPSLEFLWPTHPNPKVQEALIPARPWLPNFILTTPMPTVAFARMLAASRCVITDSGGVQEEAAALGVPCLVAREKTDRPESVEIGLAKVVGRTAQGLLDGMNWALGFQARCTPSDCFGDGHASGRIVGHLLA